MASRFEDLRAWQAARQLTDEVYGLIRRQPFARDFAVSDQIRRASISTMNNIAEGFDAGSTVEFARFLRYAARSASEVQSCLYVALDQRYLTRADFAQPYERAANVRKLCTALIRSLRGARSRSDSSCDGVAEAARPVYGTETDRLARSVARPATGHRPPATPFAAEA